LKLFGVDNREELLPRVDDNFFYNRLRKTFPAKGQRRVQVIATSNPGCLLQLARRRGDASHESEGPACN
jgi:hypothetical protein